MTGTPSAVPALAARDLVKSYGREPALDGLTITVEAGTVHALVGLNGAGKTTLMRTLLAMVTPDAGRVTVLGHDPASAGPALWRRVGHMIDHPFGYPELTTAQNVVCAARLRGLDRSAALVATDAIIDRLGLRRWACTRSARLSTGNRQRLGIACAAVHAPDVLILDEPTSALDPAGVLLVRALIAETAAGGGSVLVSSHHLDEMARVADRISVIHAGRVVGTLPPGGTDLERSFFQMVYDIEARREAPC